MKKHYLITANAGTGKSSVARTLQKMGYESYDLEDIKGLFDMYRKDTGKKYVEFDTGNPEHIANAEWLCDIKKLKELLSQQKNDIGFYAVAGNNMDQMIPLFDKTFLLVVGKETLYKRLLNREGTKDMGGNEVGRQAVLSWKEWWENEMRKYPVIEITAEGTSEEIANAILTRID